MSGGVNFEAIDKYDQEMLFVMEPGHAEVLVYKCRKKLENHWKYIKDTRCNLEKIESWQWQN